MEGIWETQKGAPAVLFAIPDEQQRKNHFEISIPNLASFYLVHDWNGKVQGLNDFIGKHPPVAPVFWAFRLMVGTGLLMLAVSWVGAWQLRKRKAPSLWLARVLVGMSFAGWIATLSGWYVTEIGRQPYLVYGVMTTAQAASQVPSGMIASTLLMYLVLYVALIAAYISVLFFMARKAGQYEIPLAENPAQTSPWVVKPETHTVTRL